MYIIITRFFIFVCICSSHLGTHSTMTRGISANLEDMKDDMSYGRSPPSKQIKKLPPIHHDPEEEHHLHNHRHHHHFSPETEQLRHDLQPVIEQARKEGKHVELVRDQLYINNILYHPEETSQHIRKHAGHATFY